MGFDLNNAINENLEKAQDVVNEKAGKEVVNDDLAQKAKDVASDVANKLGEKFNK
ncbi:ribosome recycling factor [Rothia sp. P5764]|uniref:ribosome recycling factor n=1 Tax=unclassified Rothia (in: high G+C Gram-positive bacteria) TaxID=2689056 RepID=UPI003AC27472